MNYPDFLNENQQSTSSPTTNDNTSNTSTSPYELNSNKIYPNNNNQNNNMAMNNNLPPQQVQFNTLLFNKLSALDDSTSPSSATPSSPLDFYYPNNKDSFNLPIELQGGVSNISSRRPSYAAESFTRNNFYHNNNTFAPQSPQLGSQSSNFFNSNKDLSSLAIMNNYAINHQHQYNATNFDLNDSFSNLNLNNSSKFNDFQSRRPSQLVDFPFNPFYNGLPLQNQHQSIPQPQQQQPTMNNSDQQQKPQQQPQQQQQQQLPPTSTVNGSQQQQQQQQPSSTTNGGTIKLENGLMLRDQYIIASPELKNLFIKTIKYFQDPKVTMEILTKLNNLLMNPIIIKLITFIKNLNNLTFNHKILCLVINKNGKFDLLSYPHNSNIYLQKNDLVIVDGDRGKDLVMIIEPLINLNFAILFNFLKKLEHLKSLTIIEDHHNKTHGGTHPTSMNASTIINSHSNEDNEFIITLPTKQVLRFATPKEVHKISGKFLEEKKAFITCFNKIKELNLQNDLTLINVEYQCDFKKLIFYYFAGFKRIDFRGLIKELFKIYKTRIWLCAVLPYDKPELYITQGEEDQLELKSKSKEENVNEDDLIPREYELTNDQILNFSINEFNNLESPNYFHSINVLNLIKHLSNEIKGNFYGFNTGNINNNNTTTTTGQLTDKSSNNTNHENNHNNGSDRSKILPNFNPFGDFQ
ncbi:hypothetical protein SBY92_004410 [Candida maltosa Xu316]